MTDWRRNGSGYISPTEVTAIKHMDYVPDKPRKQSPTVMREGAISNMDKARKTPHERFDEVCAHEDNLKRVRQMYAALCCIAGMMDITIVDIEMKCKVS